MTEVEALRAVVLAYERMLSDLTGEHVEQRSRELVDARRQLAIVDGMSAQEFDRARAAWERTVEKAGAR